MWISISVSVFIIDKSFNSSHISFHIKIFYYAAETGLLNETFYAINTKI